ncbi:glycosyltransferase family 39 protein [Gloeocapsa sp. PCC 73106]|uniref:ArnT family glycosyltransferase n=1 Tax=Gloeocapsa sp. PCC 73106 TaxID=102232 RepID=UPI0002ABBCD0|nr:glycosyltransferase family 39 protein [Gloeocapsa sp. PCC 73106]ELR98356.1 PMT family glycosyltransferase, 4-amino-4-deoxy-L-arabinose transferase [Gloeocapsa sp. PCC 73106]
MNKSAWLWCGAIAFIAFLVNLGSTGLVDETEPLFAEAARGMKVSGDWITPYFNGETRFDKPPLVYWGMAIAFHLLGVNEWGVRLPSALGAIAVCFLAFYTVLRFHPKGSYLVPPIFAFNLHTLIWARTGVSDMLLTGCISSALLCFFWGYSRGDQLKTSPSLTQFPSNWYLAFYILLALAVLTKGPVGLILPGLIVVAFLIYTGNMKAVLGEMGIIWGTIIFLGLSVPWYVLVILRHGNSYISNFFGYHNLERFTSVVNRHSAPWYFYFLVILVLFAPWSVYLPVAIARVKFWRRRFWRLQPRSQQLSLFALVWFVTVFGFFSIAVTKLPSYTLPLIPAASILVSLLWSEIKVSRPILISIVANIVLVFILAVFFWYSPQIIGPDPAVIDLPEIIAASGLPERGAVIWALTGIVMIFLVRNKQWWRWIIWTNLVGFVAFFLLVLTPTVFLIDSVRQLPLRQLSTTAIEVQKPQEELFMLGFTKPSVVFYTQNHVNFFRSSGSFEDHLQAWREKQTPTDSMLIITYTQKLEEFELDQRDYELIEQQGVYLLLRVAKI